MSSCDAESTAGGGHRSRCQIRRITFNCQVNRQTSRKSMQRDRQTDGQIYTDNKESMYKDRKIDRKRYKRKGRQSKTETILKNNEKDRQTLTNRQTNRPIVLQTLHSLMSQRIEAQHCHEMDFVFSNWYLVLNTTGTRCRLRELQLWSKTVELQSTFSQDKTATLSGKP